VTLPLVSGGISGDRRGALEFERSAMPKPPAESVETLLEQGTTFMVNGDYRRAILCFRRAQTLAPFRDDIRELLAEAIDGRLANQPTALDADFGGNQFAKTIEAHRRPLHRHHHRSFALRWGFPLALTALALAAIGGITLAISRRPAQATSYIPGLDDPSRASPEAAAPPVEVTPTVTPESLIEQARTKVALNQFEDALALLDEAMRLGPEDPAPARMLYADLHQRRGRRYFDSGRYSQALASYTKSTDYDPNNAETFYSMGWCHYYIGVEEGNSGNQTGAREELQRAVEAFSRSIELDPNLAKSQRSLGQALIRLGDRERAFEAWRRAVQLDPSGPDGQRARSFLESYGMRAG
jgi:tetratricopeptide (TPR) repeat protein